MSQSYSYSDLTEEQIQEEINQIDNSIQSYTEFGNDSLVLEFQKERAFLIQLRNKFHLAEDLDL